MSYTAKNIFGLPYSIINTLFSLRLEHGTVHLSDEAIRHIKERHPNDFTICMPVMEEVIKNPDYLGRKPHHLENFEVIKHKGNAIILVAVSSIQNEHGKYPVMSSYLIPESALQRRLRKAYIIRHP